MDVTPLKRCAYVFQFCLFTLLFQSNFIYGLQSCSDSDFSSESLTSCNNRLKRSSSSESHTTETHNSDDCTKALQRLAPSCVATLQEIPQFVNSQNDTAIVEIMGSLCSKTNCQQDTANAMKNCLNATYEQEVGIYRLQSFLHG